MTNKTKGISLVVIATVFWGIMGVTSRSLSLAGLDATSISFFRCSLASIGFLLWLLKTNKEVLKVNKKGLIICSIYGIITFALCFVTFNMSVARVPISIATVLMFTNPIWVTIFNAIFFKEKITLRKVLVIALAMIGCLCIANVFSGQELNLDILGIIAGAITGVLFALQIVIPRFYKETYKKDTMLIYGFISSTIVLAFFTDFSAIQEVITNNVNPTKVILNILSIGLLSTFISNTFYVKATEYIDTSLTSILVALEPVLGSVFAFIIFNETLNLIQILGAIIIVLSAMLLEFDFSKFKNKKQAKTI